MTSMDWFFSMSTLNVVIMLLTVLFVFMYTFMVSFSKPHTHPPVDLMAGDEGED